jgi:hypothetical protein
MELESLNGSEWRGSCELWEDPMGDVAQKCDCSVTIDDGTLAYRWSYKGTPHQGRLALNPGGAEFSDSWHQQEPVTCVPVERNGALAAVQYTYMETWGWRISVCIREPTGELVVQMTNIAPWGEEARAVRIACQRLVA